jgi:hypothetical protein
LQAYLEAERPEDLNAVAEDVRADEAALEELSADFYVHRAIGRAEFFKTRDTLNARLEANRARLAANSSGSILATIDAGESLERRWRDETLEWKRAVIGAIIESITINPPAVHGRREFDPSAIDVVWRF